MNQDIRARILGKVDALIEQKWAAENARTLADRLRQTPQGQADYIVSQAVDRIADLLAELRVHPEKASHTPEIVIMPVSVADPSAFTGVERLVWDALGSLLPCCRVIGEGVHWNLCYNLVIDVRMIKP